jgi:type III pantothenate kinase
MNPVQEPYKLVIDLGNSRAKVAVYMHDELTVVHTIGEPTPEKIYQMGLHKLPIAAGIICSVAENPALYTVLFPDLTWIILESQTPLPIRNKYQTPETLGKDRLAAVSGAHFLYPGHDLLVIDAGTAVTYDFLNHKGEYHGGSISPGLSMRFRALYTFTSRLPLLQAEEITFLTGCNTRESILSGVINGLCAEMDGIIDQYKLSWPSIQIVLTGGDAKYFEKTLKNSIFASPNLVLTGLKLILDYNLEK